LWVLPYPRVCAWVAAAQPTESATPGEARRIGAAVARVSPFVPRATCLAQGLTAQLLLLRAGLPARLCLGARRRPEFAAHAWVESGGDIVLGADPSFPELLDPRAG
jgi:Transglutaminase-like superfamily